MNPLERTVEALMWLGIVVEEAPHGDVPGLRFPIVNATWKPGEESPYVAFLVMRAVLERAPGSLVRPYPRLGAVQVELADEHGCVLEPSENPPWADPAPTHAEAWINAALALMDSEGREDDGGGA